MSCWPCHFGSLPPVTKGCRYPDCPINSNRRVAPLHGEPASCLPPPEPAGGHFVSNLHKGAMQHER